MTNPTNAELAKAEHLRHPTPSVAKAFELAYAQRAPQKVARSVEKIEAMLERGDLTPEQVGWRLAQPDSPGSVQTGAGGLWQ